MRMSLSVIAAAMFVWAAVATPAAACVTGTTIGFDWGSDRINDEGRQRISNLAGEIRRSTDHYEKIIVIGHSDRTGSKAHRQHISLARAQSVRDMLITLGVPAAMIVADGHADRFPVVDTPDGVREPANRRVTIGFTMSAAGLAARDAARAQGPVPIC